MPDLAQANFGFLTILKRIQQTTNTKRHEAANDELNFEESLACLPDLWKYSLLWCGLQNHASYYPASVYEALIWLGHESLALDLVERLTISKEKGELLLLVAKILAKRGNNVTNLLKECGKIATQLEHAEWQLELQLKVADALHKTGETKLAYELLQQACPVAQRSGSSSQPQDLLKVALGLITLSGDKDTALAILVEVDKPKTYWWDDDELNELYLGAQILSKAGQQTHALERLAKAKELAYKPSLDYRTLEELAKISAVLMEIGEKEQARLILDEVIKKVQSKSKVPNLHAVLEYILVSLIAFGEATKILELLEGKADLYDLISLTEKLIKLEQFGLANLLLEQALKEATNPAHIKRHPDEPNYKPKLAILAAKLGKFDIAQEIIKTVSPKENIYYLLQSFASLAAIFAKAGQSQPALEMIGKVEWLQRNGYYPINLSEEVFDRLIELKDFKHAEFLAYRNRRNSEEQAELLYKLVAGLVKDEQLDKALQIATDIDSDGFLTNALELIIVSLIATQDWDKARTVISKVPNKRIRRNFLKRINNGVPLISKGIKPAKPSNVTEQAILISPSHALKLVQKAWLEADTQKQMVDLLTQALPLLNLQPILIGEFVEALEWVDTYYQNS